MAAWNPLTAYQGNPQYGGINPQSQFSPQAALWQNPLLLAALQNGGSQNLVIHPFAAQQIAAQQLAAQQLAQHIVAQQLATQQIAAQQFGLQPPLVNQQSGLYPQIGQIGLNGQPMQPFGQIGMPLAPQSWVGQAGQPGGGQTNPVLLAQLTARALQAQGFAPGVGFSVLTPD